MVKHKTEVPAKKVAVLDKKADLAGPGIGNYADLEKILPDDYTPLLDPKETQRAITAVKRYIEDGLCRELGLMRVEVPLIVDAESGVNDYLDRDGSRGPVTFHISNDNGKHPIEAQVVQAATKWKRVALKQLGMRPGEGLVTDMRAVRKDYFLDHDHSAYVDQWDWEKVITPEQRSLEFLTHTVEGIWRVIKGAEDFALETFPGLKKRKLPTLPDKLEFLHAEDILDMYPDLPRKQRETAILQKHPAVFISRDRLDAQGRLPARDARGRLRRLGHPDAHEGRPDDARPERRHPRLEPDHEAAPRALVDGYPRERRDAQEAARAHAPGALPEVPLPPGHRGRHPASLDRRRNRAVARPHAPPAQGAPRGGQRDRVARRS